MGSSITLVVLRVEDKQALATIFASLAQVVVVFVRNWVHERPILVTAWITGLCCVLGGGDRLRAYYVRLAFHITWKDTLHSSRRVVSKGCGMNIVVSG